jgi:hypothetical protein
MLPLVSDIGDAFFAVGLRDQRHMIKPNPLGESLGSLFPHSVIGFESDLIEVTSVGLSSAKASPGAEAAIAPVATAVIISRRVKSSFGLRKSLIKPSRSLRFLLRALAENALFGLAIVKSSDNQSTVQLYDKRLARARSGIDPHTATTCDADQVGRDRRSGRDPPRFF